MKNFTFEIDRDSAIEFCTPRELELQVEGAAAARPLSGSGRATRTGRLLGYPVTTVTAATQA
jgi:hypothetical protein